MIYSPMPTGNGAYVVHKTLEKYLSNYHVAPYSPMRTLFPPSLYPLRATNQTSVIHTTPDYGLFFAKQGVPTVLTFHNYVLDSFMQKYSSHLQRLHYLTDLKYFTKKSIQQASVVTAVSHFTADLVKRELGLKDIKVIQNGVDEKKFYPKKTNIKKQRFKVLFSGNLTRRKGAHLLPAIAKKLDKHIDIYYTTGLRTKSRLPDLDNLISIDSVPHEKMPQLYQEMDALLFPSVREGLSIAALEAMASGLPVVAADATSFPELIDHNKGGILCNIVEVDDFSSSLNYLASNKKLCVEMGDYNRSRVEERFTLITMLNTYRDLFADYV